jgi:hypothetical protein
VAEGVIPSEEWWTRIQRAVEAVERWKAGGGGPGRGPSRGGPGQLPPCRWARLITRTAGPPESFTWTEAVWLAAGTWKDKPAADNPATSAARPDGFGPAYEANGAAGPDGVDKYVLLHPVWTGEEFEYRFVYSNMPIATEQYDVITADSGLKWVAGDVRAKAT